MANRDQLETGRLSQSIALTAIVIIGAALRYTHLFAHATMPDEAFTFFIAAHPLGGIVSLLQTGDFHPPLVYMIGHALFHISSRAYLFRAVTAAFSIAGIAAVYAVASRIAPRFALLAALLVALCPSLVFFDRFFRMYAMLWPLCVLSWALLLWSLDQPRVWLRWATYALCVIALLYTQYLAVFTIGGQLIAIAGLRPKTAGFWLALTAAALAFVPWLPVLAQQYPLGGSAYNQLRGHLAQMVFAPSVMLTDGLPPQLEFSLVTAVALWVVLAAGIALALARRQWLALALCSPVVLQVAYSLLTGKLLLGQRYLLQGVPAACILIAVVVAWLSTTRLRVIGLALSAALLFLMAFGSIDELFLSPYQPIDWTVYGRFLGDHVRAGDAIVFDGAMAYYPLIGSAAVDRAHPLLVADQKDIPALLKSADPYRRVWYVDYQSQLPDPQHQVFTGLKRSHPQHRTWRTTNAAYGDIVLTTLFFKDAAGKRGP